MLARLGGPGPGAVPMQWGRGHEGKASLGHYADGCQRGWRSALQKLGSGKL